MANVKNIFYVEGTIQNKNVTLNDKNIKNFIKPHIPKIDLSDVNFNSKNQFTSRWN